MTDGSHGRRRSGAVRTVGRAQRPLRKDSAAEGSGLRTRADHSQKKKSSWSVNKFLKCIFVNKMLFFASQISQVKHSAQRGRGSGPRGRELSSQACKGAAPRRPASAPTAAAQPGDPAGCSGCSLQARRLLEVNPRRWSWETVK